ncbi:MAG: pyridoxal-phosphate dependent enzyme, partial [Chloroflexota bacterium]
LDRGIHPEEQGNLLLDHLFLANVKLIESQEPTDAAREMQDLSDRLETEGRTVFIIPRGGSIPAGATGYAAMIPELLSQIADAGEHVTDLYLATGSCGTHSGVMAGLTVSESDIAVQGISVSRPEHLQREKVVALGNETLRHLGLTEQIDPEKVRVDDGFVGAGYGKPTAQCMEAINILAADEGMVLDPVYTAKAMAGLIEHTRSGKLSSSDTVVFVHTGGSPALFAYHAEAEAALATTEA